MVCEGITTLKNGVALGEVQTHGKLLDPHQNPLAHFRQTYRLVAGRRFAEITIHLQPLSPPQGYPWHAYYGARWAWRDMQSRLNKSIHHAKLQTLQTRPETPGFLEIENSTGRVCLFSGGLPFWQRQGSRMLDALLHVEGETASTFHFALSVDDDLPHVTEQDWLTPTEAIPTSTSPVHPSSWFFHLDAPSVLVMDLHLLSTQPRQLILRLLETYGYATEALLQTLRPLKSACTINALGEAKRQLNVTSEGVNLRLGCHELQHVLLEW
jgi:hypothetical protein